MIRSDTTSSVGYVQASKHRMMWKQHYLTCLACNRIFRSKSCLARTNFANLKPINSIKDLLNQKTVPASRCEWKHQTGSGRTGWSTAGQWYQCHFALQKAKRISRIRKGSWMLLWKMLERRAHKPFEERPLHWFQDHPDKPDKSKCGNYSGTRSRSSILATGPLLRASQMDWWKTAPAY